MLFSEEKLTIGSKWKMESAQHFFAGRDKNYLTARAATFVSALLILK